MTEPVKCRCGRLLQTGITANTPWAGCPFCDNVVYAETENEALAEWIKRHQPSAPGTR